MQPRSLGTIQGKKVRMKRLIPTLLIGAVAVQMLLAQSALLVPAGALGTGGGTDSPLTGCEVVPQVRE